LSCTAWYAIEKLLEPGCFHGPIGSTKQGELNHRHAIAHGLLLEELLHFQRLNMQDTYRLLRSSNVNTSMRLARYRMEGGGPRDGSGGAVTDAMWAAAIGCRACARGERFSKCPASSGGGTVTEAQSGQSMLTEALISPSSPDMSTIFMPPPAEQTICMLPGLMTVEAMAEPQKSANHTSTSLAMNLEVRRECILVL
jgi:hypothetical protein